jgi:flavin-dependent dehydrogenase
VAERRIGVEGNGIAALCCLQLLKSKGYTPTSAGAKSPRLPAILISSSTQKLLADIFGPPDLFEGLPAIRERVVSWGASAPMKFPHSGVVASEQELLKRVRERLGEGCFREEAAEIASAWTIVTASGPSGGSASRAPAEPTQMHFGSRKATVREVELAGSAPTDTCWIESVKDGWLFLLPIGSGKGSLISVDRVNRELLAKSRLVSEWVRSADDTRVAEFAAYPRIRASLGGPSWLACGSAAMAFDPLCGEGTGNAAREAILACAAVGAMEAGESIQNVLAEYEMRLRLGFLRHLENCREFYAQASRSEFWQNELRTIDDGIAWTKARLEGEPGPRYRLVGFALERMG